MTNTLVRPSARAAVRHFGWLMADRLARLVLNVGVGFWVARHLGPARFGLLSYALAVAGVAALLADLGLEAVVKRELIATPERTPVLMACAGRLRLAGGAAAYGILLLGLFVGWGDGTERTLLAVAGLTLFQPVLCVTDLWFQARLAAKTSVPAQISALAAGAATRVTLILIDAPLVAFAWAAFAETVVAGALLAVLARRGGLQCGRFEPALARRLLREAWPLLVSAAAVVLYLRIDALMLRYYAGEAAVGIYSAAVRFTEIWYFVPVALASSLLPALLRSRAQGEAEYDVRLQKIYDLNAALAYALLIPMAFAAPWLVRAAYGGAYDAAAPVVVVHVWSMIFIFLGVARSQFLINEGYTRFYLFSTIAGLLLNVGLNLWLIPRYGAWGAAIATLAAQAVATWGSSFCFAPMRATAWMQTRALCIPVRWFHYVHHT